MPSPFHIYILHHGDSGIYTGERMAGHNKWSKIKRRKAGTDAQKSVSFGKIAKLLVSESKKCGGDVNSHGLKTAIRQAKAANMSAENIRRAVDRGAGPDAESLHAITYETYGPGGCAMLIDTITDNKNRTAAEVRHLLSRHGCALNSAGSASWLFTKDGEGTVSAVTTVSMTTDDGEKLDALIADLNGHDDVQRVHTNRL